MMMIAAKSICCNNNMQAFFIILYRRRTMELLKEEPSQEETTTDAFTFTQDDSNAFILTQESAFTTVIEEDDDGERRHTRRRRKNKKKQRDRVYEQLGAPCLLYRHGAHPSHPDYVLVEDNETGPSPPWAAVGSKRRFGALDPALETEMIHASIQRRHRTQARWYYPMDYPVLKSSRLWGQPDHSEEEASDEEENDRQKQKKRKGKDESEVEDSNNNIINNNNDIPQRKTKRPELHAKLAPLRKADPFGRFDKSVVDKKFEKSRVFEGVEEARKYLLETSFEDDNELDHLPLKEYINRKRVYLGELQKEHHKSILQGYRKYDHPYFPTRWKIYWYSGKPCMQLPLRRFQGSLHFSKQRKNLADPEYLAPFPPANIYQSLEESEDALQYSLDWKLEKTAPISADDPNHPCMYGNTLACFPCTCPSCQDSANQPTWCLLHPIGEIFDKVTLSTLCLPNGQGNAALLRLRRNMDTYQKRMGAVFNELYIGDTIRQIEHCGDKTSGIFLVRTSNYVTIFSTDPYKESYEGSRRSRRSSNQTSNAYTTGDSSYQSENTCWGVFQLTELHRLDLRSIGKHGGPSFCPLDVKSHPMFGNSALSPKFKFAILSQNSNNDRNVIHHFLWSSPPEEKDDSKESKTAPKPRHFLATKHTISNLKAISEIVFSPAHPMLMWAVAKSYIRPSLVPDYAMKTASFRQPRLGKGYSLFSIDLRTNQATFQWSPSASEFLPEGFHSLSGISVEWHNPNKKHTVWVSSVSAGKMWEIDGRLPCRVINMWTLPSQCDGIGATMPATVGLYGAGTLFAWPCTMTGNQRKASNDAHSDPPLLSVGKAPEAHGLHLYQRTNVAPKFQTQSIECAASASLHNWVGKKCSIAMSSMFALPDVSSKVFVCGLAPIRLPVSDFLTKSQISSLGCNVDRSGSLICAVTMTNQGDLYSQILLELRPDKNQETVDLNSPGDLPAGTTFIPVPQRNGEETGDARHDPFDKKAKKKLAGGMNLYVHSSNEMPLPRDRARATKEPKKETPLRPFKYSKAWKMPIWEKPGEGNTPGKGVKSKGCTDVMVNTKEKTRALDNGAAAVSILIGEGIHTQKSQLASVLECFDLDKEALVEKSTGEDYAARSDVTQDALDFAAEDWE